MKTKEKLDSIINNLVKDGWIHQVTHSALRKTIMLTLQVIDERTVNRYIEALETWEYIKPIGKGIWQLNSLKTPNLIKLLKDHPQTKVM